MVWFFEKRERIVSLMWCMKLIWVCVVLVHWIDWISCTHIFSVHAFRLDLHTLANLRCSLLSPLLPFSCCQTLCVDMSMSKIASLLVLNRVTWMNIFCMYIGFRISKQLWAKVQTQNVLDTMCPLRNLSWREDVTFQNEKDTLLPKNNVVQWSWDKFDWFLIRCTSVCIFTSIVQSLKFIFMSCNVYCSLFNTQNVGW